MKCFLVKKSEMASYHRLKESSPKGVSSVARNVASSNDVLNDLLSFYVDKSVIKLYCNLYFSFI